ncbi:MAG: TonB-dependent receptor [Odoribacteraceae bacterium]|jgi:outer membrane receptor protein involved in Fe transport|nr:TonB-dependent receptor [Odoribacteraceae bacterium]
MTKHAKTFFLGVVAMLLLLPVDLSARTQRQNQSRSRTQTQQQAQGGSLAGTVLDDSGSPVAGAAVTVINASTGSTSHVPGSTITATDAAGRYALHSVPVGSFTVQFSCLSRETLRVENVQITAGRTTPLDVVLKESVQQLSDVVITASYSRASATGLYARQQRLAAISDGMSADLIKKTADNNVAQVLKRVVGVTLDNDKYVNIRGMGERYNNVQLNGASMPSTEPNRRNFSFDVIPTGLVDNVTISKTFTPDLPGEFSGGLVEVNTLTAPSERFVTVTVGSGINTMTTGKAFYSNTRFAGDWLFGDVDGREWYSGYLAEQMEENAAKAARMNTYGLRRYTGQPLQNYGVTAGVPTRVGRGSLGIIAALTYRHEENTEEILEGNMVTWDYIFHPGGQNSWRWKSATSTGGVFNAGWKMPDHEINWRNLFNNRFSHTNQHRYIFKYYEGFPTVEFYSTPLQARLWQTQLDGKHELFGGRLVATWNVSYNDVTRTNPDDRVDVGHIYGVAADSSVLVDWGQITLSSNQYSISLGHVMYSHLHEVNKNAGVNLELPLVVRGNRQSLKAGYLGTFREARFEQRYMTPRVKQGAYSRNVSRPLEELYAPERFEQGELVYMASGVNGPTSDGYDGTRDVHAGYLMGNFSFFKRLRLIAGARVENTDMLVNSLDGGGGGRYARYDTIKQSDWLPSATLVYSIRPGLNLRASYNKTLVRVDFRELSNNQYFSVDDRVTVEQWVKLEQGYTKNHDARVEWYPRAGEVVSAGYFYKKFIHPVEMMLRVSADQQNRYHIPVNLEEAMARGVEVNWRKSFDFLDAIAPAFRDLYFSGNFTWLDNHVVFNPINLPGWAQVDIGGVVKRDRPMMGLSPYLVNLGLAYDGPVVGAAVNYNRLGRKLVVAGANDYEDQYENPRDVLDLQLSTRLLKHRLMLKLNASDILNQDVIIYWNRTPREDSFVDNTSGNMDYDEGDSAMSRVRKGVNVTLTLGYSF